MKFTEAKAICNEITEKHPEYAEAMKVMIGGADILLGLEDMVNTYPIYEVKDRWGCYGGMQLVSEIVKDKMNKIETS